MSKVLVGKVFDKEDITVVEQIKLIEASAKSKTTLLLTNAVIGLFLIYLVHQWWTKESFHDVGQLLTSCFLMLLGWSIGSRK